jgi:hypothetical protein
MHLDVSLELVDEIVIAATAERIPEPDEEAAQCSH